MPRSRAAAAPEGRSSASPLNNTTHAILGAATVVAGSIAVGAQEGVTFVGLTLAGAKAPSLAVAGSVGYLSQNSDTLAQIETGAQLSGGGVSVNAGGDELVVTFAGGVSISTGSGVGVGILILFINRTTRAVIGNLDLTSTPATSTTDINVTGPITVQAESSGTIWSIAVAGSIATKGSSSSSSGGGPPMGTPPISGSKAASVLGSDSSSSSGGSSGGQPPSTGVSIAGAAAFNEITDVTEAYINDRGTVNPGSAGTLTVSADESTTANGGAGGSSLDTGSGSSNNLAFGGAVSVDLIDDTTEALLIGTTVPTGSLAISATREGQLNTGTVGAAGSTASGKSAGIAGSVSWNEVTTLTEAILEGATLTSGTSATVSAQDSSDEFALGGAVGYGTTAGVGLSFGYNDLSQTTEAVIEPLALSGGGTLRAVADALPWAVGHGQQRHVDLRYRRLRRHWTEQRRSGRDGGAHFRNRHHTGPGAGSHRHRQRGRRDGERNGREQDHQRRWIARALAGYGVELQQQRDGVGLPASPSVSRSPRTTSLRT